MGRTDYIFHSERLGFRNWLDADIPCMTSINADPEVMEYFPAVQSEAQTKAFFERMQNLYAAKGYCYFAVEILATRELIGFIGICDQTFESPYTPCVDIGWRLGKQFWNQGFATEGAQKCLAYAFRELGLSRITAFAPEINRKSIGVMEKLGMKRKGVFEHPALKADQRLKNCVCYEIEMP